MIKNTFAVGLAVTAALALVPLTGAYSQTTYSDSAAAYTGNYAGLNNGTGFGAFTVTIPTGANASPPYSGTFVGDASASEDNSGTPAPSTINTTGNAFGFYANQGAAASVTITRNFSSSLTKANDAFNLDFVGGYNNNGTVGVSLLNASGNVAQLLYSGTTGQYTFNGGTTSIASFASGALHLNYTLLSATSVRLTVTGAITPAAQTATFTGPITGFRVFQTNTDSGSGDPHFNGYFNSPSYTIAASASPEPGDLTLLALGLGTLCVARRRFARG